MKKIKNRQFDLINDEYDEEDFYRAKKKQPKIRRPVRNWKKEWLTKETSAEDHDEFYSN